MLVYSLSAVRRKVKDEGEWKWQQPGVKTGGWGVNHSANNITQLLHFCPSLFVKHSQRALGHMSLQETIRKSCTNYSEKNVIFSRWRSVIVLKLRSVFAAPPVSKPGSPQMRQLFLWTMPSLAKHLLCPTLCVWPLKEEFSISYLPWREQLFSRLVL